MDDYDPLAGPMRYWRANGYGPDSLWEHEEVLTRLHSGGRIDLYTRGEIDDPMPTRRWAIEWGHGTERIRAFLLVSRLKSGQLMWSVQAQMQRPWRVRTQSPLYQLEMTKLDLTDVTSLPYNTFTVVGADQAELLAKILAFETRLAPVLVIHADDDADTELLLHPTMRSCCGAMLLVTVKTAVLPAVNAVLGRKALAPGTARVLLPHGAEVDEARARQLVVSTPSLGHRPTRERLLRIALRFGGWSPGKQAWEFVTHPHLHMQWYDIRDPQDDENWPESRAALKKRVEQLTGSLIDARADGDRALDDYETNAADLARLRTTVTAGERHRRRLTELVLRLRRRAHDAETTLAGTEVGIALGAAAEASTERDLYAEELDEAEDDLADLRRQLHWATTRLAETGSVRHAPSVEYPAVTTFGELLAAARAELTGLFIGTAVAGSAAKLDGHTRTPQWLRRSWLALSALDGYARRKAAGEDVRDFPRYVADPARSTGIARSAVMPAESRAVETNARFRVARTFPVPTELNATGQLYMPAHIRIGRGGGVAPRLYYYDDCTGPTGRMHVGYLGPHLPNVLTN